MEKHEGNSYGVKPFIIVKLRSHLVIVISQALGACFTHSPKTGVLNVYAFSESHSMTNDKLFQWKRISHKQSARWQHLSQLKARALFFLKKKC
jgi:hypothetical protein